MITDVWPPLLPNVEASLTGIKMDVWIFFIFLIFALVSCAACYYVLQLVVHNICWLLLYLHISPFTKPMANIWIELCLLFEESVKHFGLLLTFSRRHDVLMTTQNSLLKSCSSFIVSLLKTFYFPSICGNTLFLVFFLYFRRKGKLCFSVCLPPLVIFEPIDGVIRLDVSIMPL